jgi:tetratricopeptide (TPR) repeat protein
MNKELSSATRWSRASLWLVILLLALPIALAASDKPRITDQDRRKAEYIFLEAQNQKQHDKLDAYYDLLKAAYDIDSTNTSVSFYLGYCLLTMENMTKQRAERGLELMRKHFEEAPGDFYETTFYSDACMMLGKPQESLRAIKTLCDRNPNKLELQARLAHAQAQTGDFTGAIETFDSIEALHGKSMQITSRKVSAYMAMNDTASAINEMHALLATAPENANYNITMSGLLVQLGRQDSALVYLDRAQQVEPDNGYTYLAKAQYYNMVGDSAAYEQQVRQALINENLEVDDKMTVLVDFMRDRIAANDSTGRVDALMNVLLEQHPHEPKIHDLYSEYFIARKNYRQAAEQLGYVLDVQPTDAQMWRKLMIVNIMDENIPAAIVAGDKALEYNPDSLDLYRYIAPAYFQIKQYDKSLQTYERAIALTDSADVISRSDFIGGMGDVYFEMGDTVRAFEHYEQSLQLNPLNTGIMNNYAYFLSLSERDLDKAERMAALAVKDQPQNATYLDTYAWVFFKKKDYQMALLYIKSALDNDDSPSGDLLDHYGDILFMTGDHEAAVEQWQKALELMPDNELLQRKVKHRTIFFK